MTPAPSSSLEERTLLSYADDLEIVAKRHRSATLTNAVRGLREAASTIAYLRGERDEAWTERDSVKGKLLFNMDRAGRAEVERDALRDALTALLDHTCESLGTQK